MTLKQRLTSAGAAALALLALGTGPVLAQTPSITVNGTACPNATAAITYGGSTGVSGIAINTSGCGGSSSNPPTLSMLAPTSATPGATVTASGTNFASGATVSVGGTAASNVVVTNSTTLTFTVPNVSAGMPSVTVTVAGQTSNGQNLTVTPLVPTVTALSPMSAKPGDTVTVTGTNFVNGATATVNGVNAPATFTNSTTLSIVVPAVSAAAHQVVVTVSGNASATSANSTLTVTAATPMISSVTSAAVGQTATITGTGFAPGATVVIGGAAATVVGNPSATSIVATVPNVAAGAQVVTVTVAGVAANGAMTVNAPASPSITACTGSVGGTFSLTGANLTGASLTISGFAVTSPTVTATTIAGNVPASISAANATAPVVVTVGALTANGTCNISASAGLRSVEGNLIPNPSKIAKMNGPVHAPENGAGDGINAWRVDSMRCGTPTPSIAKYWHHNIDFDDYARKVGSDNIYMAPNEAITYQFTGPTTGPYLGDVFLTQASGSQPATTFVSISTTPCDFDVAKANMGNACYTSEPTENGFQFNVTSGTAPGRCKIEPGMTYYLNVRFIDRRSPSIDTCQASGQPFCGVFLQIRKY